MSIIVDVSADGARTPLASAKVKRVAAAVLTAEGVRDALVSIAFVSAREIARLNRLHLAHAGPTDVISFALGAGNERPAAHPVIGDIYIAPDVARANAMRFGRGIREELARLVIHGTLHVLGHDHPDGLDRTSSPMWRRQERLLSSATIRRVLSGARTL